MAKYELNIYKENNEIEKTYATDNIPWGFYIEAVKAYEDMQEMSVPEQFEMINGFVKRMFIGLTDEELPRASGDDVMNLFNQLIRKGRSMVVGGKNPTAAGK
jgi:hypothetical protein